jgi:outer membrane protein assembly factor BamB
MNGFEIVVSPERRAPAVVSNHGRVIPLRGVAKAHEREREPMRGREVIDLVVSGVNLTARVEPDQAPCVVRDLALALVDLACGVRRRAVVRFYDAPWEIGLERLGDELALSVIRNGADVEVAVHDRRTTLAEAVAGTRVAIDGMLESQSPLARVLGGELEAARDALAGLGEIGTIECAEEVLAIVEAESGLRCAFGAELPLRVTNDSASASVEMADVHALLGRGRLRAVIRGRTKDLGEVHPFLVAERLIDLGTQVLDHWERGKALHTRVLLGHADVAGSSLGGPLLGVRLEPEGALTVSLVTREPERSTASFPSLEGPDFVDATVSYARALTRAIVRRDRRQSSNLRLSSLRRKVKDLSERLRDVARPVGPFGESDLVNPHRASYAPYLVRTTAQTPRPAAPPPVRRMKYEARWTAEVPGIDMRATFLCGDRLVLSGVTQTACVDRMDGRTLWKVQTVRATSVPTAGGLARLRGDGRLELRDFGDGSVVWSTPCAPRSRGTPAACTVVAPGLPRLLVATDGDRHLVAFDLTSGEPRWRYTLTRPGAIRVRRAGRLLIVSSDEAQLVALDAVDGNVVWRVRDRLRFAAPAAIEREDLYAIAGEPGGLARLHAIDSLSGARRYERALEAPIATDSAPILIGGTALILTRDRRGVGMLAIDRITGVERWSAAPGTWPAGTSPLGIDGLVVLNQPTGEVVALTASTGETAWRHVFEAPIAGDAPRRLEPVLRSGALFVPQDKVRVLRPADGAIVGMVGSDLVPDLLRVDERCDVYLAEESGHVAAFAASTRLEVVPGGAPRPRLSIVRS